MITLDMTKKADRVRILDNAFTLESGVLTLLISLGSYSLTGKTVTAAFSPNLVETGSLVVTEGVIAIPITPSLVTAGNNHIQLNIRTATTLEQSPIMLWQVGKSILATNSATEDPDLIGSILADIIAVEAGKVDKVTGKELSANDFTDLLETKLNGIEESANNYTHPANHAPSIITQDETNRFVTDTEKSTWNGKQDALGFTAENVSNKKTTLTDNSDTFYPSQKAVKTAVDALNVSNANYLSRFIDKMLAGQTVVVSILGDSILEGSTASVPGTTDAASIICAKLATRYNTTVTKNNVAASGDRLYNTLIGTAKYIDAVTDGSDLIIIGFGRNDMKSEPTYTTAPGYGYPLDNWKGCYEHLLRRIRRDLPDCDILILFENPGAVSATTVNALHEEQNVYLTELATLYGCAISDCYSAFTALVDWDSYLSDGSHPNDAGFKLMADTTLLLFNPTLNNVAPSNQRPFIPNILYDTAKTHLKNSWLNKTSNESVPVTANEPRYYFGGTWVGHVSSTPASYVNCIYTGSEAFLGMVCGTDQAVVDIYLDQALVWDNLDLSALSAGTRYIPIFATDEGIHSIRVVIISGTLEFDGFTVKKGNVELIKADDARITYSGTYTLNVSTSYFSLFYNTATLAITAPAGVAEFEFYGTGIGIETQRYSQTTPRGFKVTIDGGTEQTVISQTPAIALGGLYSGLVLASGLVYGRHTIRLEPVGNTTALAANGYFILGAKSAV